MSDVQKIERYWYTATELPREVFEAWHKPGNVISPVAIVATVDPDGTPHVAPFGSVRAITPRLLRLCSSHDHSTYANLRRDGHVSMALISPPDISMSIKGRARLVREQMELNPRFAILEIDIEGLKNDMVHRVVIDSAIVINAREEYKPWYEAIMSELGSIE